MAKYEIPFNRPCFAGKELVYIAEAINSGWICGDSSFTKKCQAFLEAELGVEKVFLTTSCTHALEMAALLLDIKQGDEIIVPSFTFVSTVNAFVLRGAKPVFIDIRPDTLNLNETQIERLITKKTRAIIPVHYAGIGCEMDCIMETAAEHGIPVVEDNAHGLFAKYKGKYLGTFGCMGTQSFHETKNIICGEGGALVVNDPGFVSRAEIVREKGTNRSQFFRGEIDKYTWVDIGSSYLLSDIVAAFLYAQLEMKERIQRDRKRIWETYYEQLRDWAEKHGVKMPTVPKHCEQAYHMFYLLVPSAAERGEFINYLKGHGILSVFHYLPLHLSQMGEQLGGQKGDCPVTEDVSERLVRLPFYNDMSEDDQRKIIEAIKQYHAS